MAELLVSGVGRSGTTALYDFLTRYFEYQGVKSTSFFEPFLWRLKDREFDKSEFKSTNALNITGMCAHCTLPLFSADKSVPDGFKDFIGSLQQRSRHEYLVL